MPLARIPRGTGPPDRFRNRSRNRKGNRRWEKGKRNGTRTRAIHVPGVTPEQPNGSRARKLGSMVPNPALSSGIRYHRIRNHRGPGHLGWNRNRNWHRTRGLLPLAHGCLELARLPMLPGPGLTALLVRMAGSRAMHLVLLKVGGPRRKLLVRKLRPRCRLEDRSRGNLLLVEELRSR